MFTAEQRTKEIGIRKVLGASPASLFALMSGEFLVLIVLAMFIASPLAWYAMRSWLSEYAYRIQLSWWLFPLGGLAAIVIALSAVSFQTIKAPLVNPARSLRAD